MKIVADRNIPFAEECFSHLGRVCLLPGRQITSQALADADILLVRSVTTVDEKLLKGSSVKFVATATIGFEHIDLDYLSANNIGFASAPGSNSNSVAEYIVAALLFLAGRGKFTLEGKSVGIVGLGNVGSKVDIKCRALGIKTVLNDPPLARETGDPKYQPIDKIFQCDFITLHTPLTYEGQDKTYHLADKNFFSQVSKGAYFINTARGAVMETVAVKNAVKNGGLAGVVLDVWENEPNIDCELVKMADIATPHIAGYSFDGKVGGMIMIYNAVCAYLGVKQRFTVSDFLPDSDESQVKLAEIQGAESPENLLREVLWHSYVINRDDFNTREILLQGQDKRGEFFDKLRKDYPVRREFGNTTVLVQDSQSFIADKLKGIGFKVRREE